MLMYGLTLGDVNGDGNLDIVTTGVEAATDNVRVRLGNGDGTFSTNISYSTPGTLLSITLKDVNQDGYDDLAYQSDTAYAGVLLGQGDGSFASPISEVSTFVADPQTIQLEDLDNDGVLDLLVLGYAPGGEPISVALGNGDGTYQTPTTFGTLGQAFLGDTADVDGDGNLDIVHLSDFGGVFVRRGLGDGTFSAAEQIDAGTYNYLELADTNGDGSVDILVSQNSTGSVLIFNGSGTGTFSFSTTISDMESDIHAGDFNNDGVIDILGRDGTTTRFSVALGETTSGVSPLLDFSLKSIADAKYALSRFDQKLDQLTAQRGTVGAFMSRTEFASSHLQSLSENSLAAASRIRDADIASEAADLVRLQILQQSSTAVLAQANLQPQLVLTLLKSTT